MAAVLGIDPGAVATGMVVVNLDGSPRVLHHMTVMAPKPSPLLPVLDTYVDDLLDAIMVLHRDWVIDLAGVEGVTKPSWHLARGGAALNPEALLATAWVGGICSAYVRSLATPTVTIPPAGNGGGALGFYPAALISDRERTGHQWQARSGSTAARLRHVRSAFDVAVLAHRLSRKVTR